MEEEVYLPISHIARELKISTTAISAAIHNKELDAYYISKVVKKHNNMEYPILKVKLSSVKKWLNSDIDYIPIKDASNRYNISYSSLLHHCQRKTIKSKHIRARWFVHVPSLLDYYKPVISESLV